MRTRPREHFGVFGHAEILRDQGQEAEGATNGPGMPTAKHKEQKKSRSAIGHLRRRPDTRIPWAVPQNLTEETPYSRPQGRLYVAVAH